VEVEQQGLASSRTIASLCSTIVIRILISSISISIISTIIIIIISIIIIVLWEEGGFYAPEDPAP
jgi:hypothetical protein